MHGGVDQSAVIVVALDIARTVVPIDPKRVDRRAGIIRFGMQEFHDTTQIVWLARRLAYQVHVICLVIRVSPESM